MLIDSVVRGFGGGIGGDDVYGFDGVIDSVVGGFDDGVGRNVN